MLISIPADPNNKLANTCIYRAEMMAVNPACLHAAILGQWQIFTYVNVNSFQSRTQNPALC